MWHCCRVKTIECGCRFAWHRVINTKISTRQHIWIYRPLAALWTFKDMSMYVSVAEIDPISWGLTSALLWYRWPGSYHWQHYFAKKRNVGACRVSNLNSKESTNSIYEPMLLAPGVLTVGSRQLGMSLLDSHDNTKIAIEKNWAGNSRLHTRICDSFAFNLDHLQRARDTIEYHHNARI